ncbi:MAG: tetratricopeptide repeat protein [Elusimicrobia bacterium]|nr:tetratricopeptide repeat protein [Elusimicrobiota bacterium]
MKSFLAAALLGLLAACAHKKPDAPPPEPAKAVESAASQAAVSVALSTSASVQQLLTGIEAAYRAGRYDDGLKLVGRVMALPRKDLSIYDRVGSIYYLLGRYGEALSVWEQALKLEKRKARRQELQDSISMARRTLGLPEPEEPKTPKVVLKPKKRPKPKARPDPKLVEELYDQGVAHYAKGEYLQAASDFYAVLDLDPEHALAKSALARLKLKPGAVDTGKNGNPL